MVKDNKNKNNNSSNSLVFGRRPQTNTLYSHILEVSALSESRVGLRKVPLGFLPGWVGWNHDGEPTATLGRGTEGPVDPQLLDQGPHVAAKNKKVQAPMELVMTF